MTTYILLKATNEPGTIFAIDSEVEASSQRSAISTTVGDPGIWVAIPKRSWRPVVVEEKTTTVRTVRPL